MDVKKQESGIPPEGIVPFRLDQKMCIRDRITENRLNLGFSADNSQEADQKVMKDKVMEELKKAFRPEFLNRIDDIIVFQKLTQEEIQQIAVHMMNDLKARLEPLGVSLEFTEEAVRTIAKAGFDPVYGCLLYTSPVLTEILPPMIFA